MDIIKGSVVACIDGSRYSAAVCDYAAWISLRTEAPLTLLHNIEHSPNAALSDLSGAIGLGSQEVLLDELTDIEAQRNRLMFEQGKLMLQAARERVIAAGISSPALVQRHDGLTESLIEFEDNIRVLVLGVRGAEHEQDDHHLGTHLESSIRALHRPILVVNCDFAAPENIMLAYDGSDASGKALDMLITSPLFTGLPLHLVTVGESAQNAHRLQDAACQRLNASGHEVTAVTMDGKPSEALSNYQAEHNIDLTLMGAFSHNRLRELVLGSVTARMLLRAQQPLLLLR